MRLLGASNAGAAVAAPQPAKAVSPSAVAVPPPQAPDQAAGVTATQTPAVPSAEAAAAAAAAPSAADLGSPAPVQGPAAVGWRMALQFEGGHGCLLCVLAKHGACEEVAANHRGSEVASGSRRFRKHSL